MHGKSGDFSFCGIFNDRDNDDENSDHVRLIQHSSYYGDDYKQVISNKNKNFNILSSNVNSIFAKYDEIAMLVNDLNDNDCRFEVMCFQECYLNEKSDKSSIQIPGYQCICSNGVCSTKGGLVIYIAEEYNFKRIEAYQRSNQWEGMFVEIFGSNLKSPIIVGNMYRSPKTEEVDYDTFNKEFLATLEMFNDTRKEIILARDYNINLLKINEKPKFNEFFEEMLSKGLIPRITLLTRITNTSATLIDNFFCSVGENMENSTAGILTSMLLDHQPYFLSLKNVKGKDNTPELMIRARGKPTAVEDMIEELRNANIMGSLDTSPSGNPDINYQVLDNIIAKAREKHFPIKQVKFNKKVHKKM